jgi:hypothetical protein
MRMESLELSLHSTISGNSPFYRVTRFSCTEALSGLPAVLHPVRGAYNIDGMKSLVNVIVGNCSHLLHLNLLLESIVKLLGLLLFLALLLVLVEEVGIFLVHGLSIINEVR